MLLTTIEIRKTEVEVHVDRHGTFRITMPGEKNSPAPLATAGTLEGVKQGALVELRRRAVRVSVPFTMRNGQKAVATGRHAGNDDVLATLEDGTKERLGYRPVVFSPETPKDVIDTYWAHEQSIRTHKAAMKAIDDAWNFNLGAAVDNAVREATGETAVKQASEAT